MQLYARRKECGLPARYIPSAWGVCLCVFVCVCWLQVEYATTLIAVDIDTLPSQNATTLHCLLTQLNRSAKVSYHIEACTNAFIMCEHVHSPCGHSC